MPIKSFAAKAEHLPAANALLAFATGRDEQHFSPADYKVGGVYYGLAVGEFPLDEDFDESIFDNEVSAPTWLGQRGLELFRNGEILKSRAQSVETAIESLELTPCIVQEPDEISDGSDDGMGDL